MKTIGFVDYYISEWHANNYPKWIKEACEKAALDFEVKYVWAEEYVSPVSGENTDEWCKRFGAVHCESIDELCEKCDFIIILAPSNPEKHLSYAEAVLKWGKRTYIDKTFAPDYSTAKKIFELGEKYGAKLFSSSALRYSPALDGLENSVFVTTFGCGSNFEEYIVHQCEMVIAVLKCKPLFARVEKQGGQYLCSVKLAEGREATMIYSPTIPYAINAEFESGGAQYRTAEGGHFERLISDIISFFDGKDCSFDSGETLDVMKLREAVIKGVSRLGEWIEIE